MLQKIILYVAVLVLVSCHSNKKQKPDCESLSTQLKQIDKLDQKYRIEENQILNDYGHDSEEHKLIWELISLIDEQNSNEIEEILNKYGYPQLDGVGKSAALTPILVIHHSPSQKGLRYRYFNLFYNAYLRGDIEEGFFCLYLERMYSIKSDKYFEMPSPYKLNEKIDTLISLLELHPVLEAK